MKRLAGLLVLATVLLLSAGCRGEADPPPAPSGVNQQVSDVESTLDAIETEMAGD
jgi:hypothetical protein